MTGRDEPRAGSARAAELADNFERLNAEVVAVVSDCPAESWSALTESEGWTVAAVATHIADGYGAVAGWSAALAAGQAVATTLADINGANAEAAPRNASRAPDDVVALLQRRAARLATQIRSYSDAQLATAAPFAEAHGDVSVERILAGLLMRHTRTHLASIRATIERKSGTGGETGE